MRQRQLCMFAAILTTILLANPLYAQPVITAGDMDNFGGVNNSPADALTIRAPFAAYLSSGGNNVAYHNGDPMPFDANDDNWNFGYSFEGLPTLGNGAFLRIRLKGVGGSANNDALSLLYTGDGTGLDVAYAIPIKWIDASAGGDGVWNFGEVATFVLPLANLPLGSVGGTNIINDINAVGYLDVMVWDDTAVDWMELVVPEPTAISLLGLGSLALIRRKRKVRM